jgi:hypothetical protein
LTLAVGRVVEGRHCAKGRRLSEVTGREGSVSEQRSNQAGRLHLLVPASRHI